MYVLKPKAGSILWVLVQQQAPLASPGIQPACKVISPFPILSPSAEWIFKLHAWFEGTPRSIKFAKANLPGDRLRVSERVSRSMGFTLLQPAVLFSPRRLMDLRVGCARATERWGVEILRIRRPLLFISMLWVVLSFFPRTLWSDCGNTNKGAGRSHH